MIMPSKHINFSESLLGFGSYVLKNLDKPKSIDELWKKYQLDLANDLNIAKQSFDNLILTIAFLHLIGAVIEIDGEVVKCG